MSFTPAESSGFLDSLPTCCKLASLLIALTIFLTPLRSLSWPFWPTQWLAEHPGGNFSGPNISPKDQIQAPGPQCYSEKALLLLSHLLKDNVIYLFSVKHKWPYLHTKVPLSGNESHLGTRHSSSLCLCQGTAERNNDILSGLGQGSSWYFSPVIWEFPK